MRANCSSVQLSLCYLFRNGIDSELSFNYIVTNAISLLVLFSCSSLLIFFINRTSIMLNLNLMFSVNVQVSLIYIRNGWCDYLFYHFLFHMFEISFFEKHNMNSYCYSHVVFVFITGNKMKRKVC